ncbi:MAG: putative sugar nucleotidyl transferase [Panacibacter sp.]
MSIILYDNAQRKKLYPLNNCCATAMLRAGIFTIAERWQLFTNEPVYIHTEDYLSALYEPIPQGAHLWIDAGILNDQDLIERILVLEEGEALTDSNGLIAGRKNIAENDFNILQSLDYFETIHEHANVKRLEYPWQIFLWNDEILRSDFEYIISKKQSQQLLAGSNYINPENIFIEEGAEISYCTINASTGPVYIGKNALIMEGAVIRGPLAVCEGAVIKMGAKIYGATTIGPFCMAGGEIKNAVLQGYSNKAHDGYLGDAVIGNWCNLGAGTTNSNVKNTAGAVKMWNAFTKSEIPVGIKCGVIIGDYSRAAINSSINTGTVIGTCSNVFGEGLLPTYIPDFNWGAAGITKYKFDKAVQDINNWKKMKGQQLSSAETQVLQHIFEQF